ncbi:hypothetical protein VW29_11435 [Devosia limi DSM 17137]|uniref:histidine kinase n=1 Tax=Devosia limi DSM 17137 TaxID=1121477 RepID=A0A0F5LPS0_9HYPH|nr:hypothetical protein VW29_11090 [Devosia limi DSM 17137]KKB84331.1 hypothetical protein VW29_11435 [Devosia limi DSM 17137]
MSPPRSGQRFAVLVSLALVLVAVAAALFLVQGVDRQLQDVIGTYDTRLQAREVSIGLAEAESGQRGYVLTQNDEYLATYRNATRDIEQDLAGLSALVADDASKAAQVASIGEEIRAKTAEMDHSIGLVAANRPSQARSLVETGMGMRLMDDVRGSLARFIANEDAQLLARNEAIERSRRWLVAAVLSALAGAAILAFSLFNRSQQQVTALSRSQSELKDQNESLEARVSERTQALAEATAHAERERERVEALLQDTNHRIGNSLATVSSLLGLQLMRSDSAEVRAALEAARSRVHAVASAHRRLRLGGDLETTQADEFLTAVLEDLETGATDIGDVTLVGEVEPIVIGARDATTLGIVVGELVTNAMKHAFPDGRSGNIIVRLQRNTEGVATLVVLDNGIGVPDKQDLGEGGLGSVIIRQLAQQFGGAPLYERRAEGGLAVTVALPELAAAGA